MVNAKDMNDEGMNDEGIGSADGLKKEENRCFSVCLLPSKSTFSIEDQSTEKSCHSEEGVSPTWESVLLNVSIIWEFGIKRRVLRIRIATATGGLAMTLRNKLSLA